MAARRASPPATRTASRPGPRAELLRSWRASPPASHSGAVHARTRAPRLGCPGGRRAARAHVLPRRPTSREASRAPRGAAGALGPAGTLVMPTTTDGATALDPRSTPTGTIPSSRSIPRIPFRRPDEEAWPLERHPMTCRSATPPRSPSRSPPLSLASRPRRRAPGVATSRPAISRSGGGSRASIAPRGSRSCAPR
jgi:hypothetical protein